MTDTNTAAIFTVVIGDANVHIRDALLALLDAHPSLATVGVASDGDTAFDLCRQHRPHLAVMDLLPMSSGRPAHEAIAEESPDTVIALHTARADPKSARRFLAAGVHAVIAKGSSSDLSVALHDLARERHGDAAT